MKARSDFRKGLENLKPFFLVYILVFMKISDSVTRIEGTTAHSYSVEHEGQVVLIDAGMKSSAKKIVDYYGEIGKKPDVILITHYHVDHIGGLALLNEKYSPKIYAPKEEIPVIEGKSRPAQPKSMLSKFVSVFGKTDIVSGVLPVEEFQSQWMKAIPTIGHTPGSTSYLFEPEGMLFVGDAVNIKGSEATVNKQFSLDLVKAEESRKKIMSMSGATILPGHGDPLKL